MREFKAQKLLDRIHSRRVGVHAVEPSLCFHTVPYSNNLFDTFGKHCTLSVFKDCTSDCHVVWHSMVLVCVVFLVKFMWTVPDPSGAILSHQKCQSNCDMEQVVILTLCGNNMNHGLSLLHRMLTERPEGGWNWNAAHSTACPGFLELGVVVNKQNMLLKTLTIRNTV